MCRLPSVDCRLRHTECACYFGCGSAAIERKVRIVIFARSSRAFGTYKTRRYLHGSLPLGTHHARMPTLITTTHQHTLHSSGQSSLRPRAHVGRHKHNDFAHSGIRSQRAFQRGRAGIHASDWRGMSDSSGLEAGAD